MDSAHQVIVAARATNVPLDKQQAAPTVGEAIGNMGAVPKEVSADAGYYPANAVEELDSLGVGPFIAPGKTRHGTRPEPAPEAGYLQGTVGQGRMRRGLRTMRGRESYALRMETAEPVFGQIEQGRVASGSFCSGDWRIGAHTKCPSEPVSSYRTTGCL